MAREERTPDGPRQRATAQRPGTRRPPSPDAPAALLAGSVADLDVVEDHVSTRGGGAAPEPLDLEHTRGGDAGIGCRQFPVAGSAVPSVHTFTLIELPCTRNRTHCFAVVTDATPANDPKLVVTPAWDFHSCTCGDVVGDLHEVRRVRSARHPIPRRPGKQVEISARRRSRKIGTTPPCRCLPASGMVAMARARASGTFWKLIRPPPACTSVLAVVPVLTVHRLVSHGDRCHSREALREDH